jgi:branched-chain amino acid transport system permease protein
MERPGWRDRIPLPLLVAGAALTVLPLVLPNYATILLTQCLIYAVLAMSLDILVGYTGLAALGHSAFFAIGAYVTAVLATKFHVGLGGTVFCGIVLSAAAAAALGLLALRAVGIYFLIITLSLAMVVWGVVNRWVSLTGGDNGISGIPRPDLFFAGSLQSILHFYYLILVLCSAAASLMFLLIRSPFGKTLVAIRDSESRMEVLGYNVWLHKYLAFIIAAAFAGFAGGLYVYYNGFVNPNVADVAHCMKVVLMVILGGPGTMIGAGLGAFLITLMENVISIYTERWVMVLALIYIVTAKYAPRGILGLVKPAGKRGGDG